MNEEVSKIVARHGLEENSFEQKALVDSIKHPFSKVWCTVFDFPNNRDNDVATFACFFDPSIGGHILDGQDWLKQADEFGPGFVCSGDETTYFTGRDEGFDYIVASQYFHTLDEEQLHLNQELVLLFNLYRGEDGDYYSVGDCGELDKCVRFTKKKVEVKTALLLRYMSAKQLGFIQFIASRVSTPGHYPLDARQISYGEYSGDNYNYFLSYASNSDKTYLMSMIYARSVVMPPSIEQCGIWPYDKKPGDENYPEFAIGERPDGKLIRYTCNPSKLANYFGANPGAPLYLTPVYFKPEVLDRYRKNVHFALSERRIECGSQWEIEIDNIDPRRVMVYLGDLGRDLPENERTHFKQYEISPVDQTISEEVVLNDFFNCFTETKGAIANLFAAYKDLCGTWKNRFGFDLYRELHPDDANISKAIRIPTSNSQEEFETVILAMAKMFVDYIDESNLKCGNRDGGINKLEDFLTGNGETVDLSALRNLQDLRSRACAHSKGAKYEITKLKMLTGDYIEDTQSIVQGITDFMRRLSEQISVDK